MLIELGSPTPQTTCPLCRDELAELASRLHCRSCATAYHSECTGWAKVCALLGCGGTFGPQRAEEQRFALVVAAGPVLDEAQVRGLADMLGEPPFEVRRRLVSRSVPWVPCYVSRPRLEECLAVLEALSVPAYGIAAELLVEEHQYVDAIAREDSGLVFRTADLRVRRLDDLPALVVRGTYEDVAPAGASRRTRSEFAHVYFRGDAKPLAFSADGVEDYAFLGADKQPSRTANFRRLLSELAPGAPRDERLLEVNGRHTPIGGGVRSNRAWMQSASHVIWLTRDRLQRKTKAD